MTVVPQPPLPEGTSTGTPWIHLQALVPLAQVAALVPYLLSFRALFAAQLALTNRSRSATLSPAAAHTLFGQYAGVFGVAALSFGLSFVLSATWVVLAVLDARRLDRIGILQPFHWAWSFLGPVYPIGRAVVLRRRVGQGLGPLWLLIAAAVASMVIAFAVEAAVILPLFARFAASSHRLSSHCGC